MIGVPFVFVLIAVSVVHGSDGAGGARPPIFHCTEHSSHQPEQAGQQRDQGSVYDVSAAIHPLLRFLYSSGAAL